MNRVLVLDAAAVGLARPGESASPMGSAMRAAVERWPRTHGVYAIAACSSAPTQATGATTPGVLAGLLLDAAVSGSNSTTSTGREANNSMSVMDWFNTAAERAATVIQRLGLDPHAVQASNKPKGFPLLAATR